MVIRQGDVYWVDLDEPAGSEPGYWHPHVVIQNDLFNASQISTTQVLTVDKEMLVEWIGRLSDRRVEQILAGLRLVTEPRPW